MRRVGRSPLHRCKSLAPRSIACCKSCNSRDDVAVAFAGATGVAFAGATGAATGGAGVGGLALGGADWRRNTAVNPAALLPSDTAKRSPSAAT